MSRGLLEPDDVKRLATSASIGPGTDLAAMIDEAGRRRGRRSPIETEQFPERVRRS